MHCFRCFTNQPVGKKNNKAANFVCAKIVCTALQFCKFYLETFFDVLKKLEVKIKFCAVFSLRMITFRTIFMCL